MDIEPKLFFVSFFVCLVFSRKQQQFKKKNLVGGREVMPNGQQVENSALYGVPRCVVIARAARQIFTPS